VRKKKDSNTIKKKLLSFCFPIVLSVWFLFSGKYFILRFYPEMVLKKTFGLFLHGQNYKVQIPAFFHQMPGLFVNRLFCSIRYFIDATRSFPSGTFFAGNKTVVFLLNRSLNFCLQK